MTAPLSDRLNLMVGRDLRDRLARMATARQQTLAAFAREELGAMCGRFDPPEPKTRFGPEAPRQAAILTLKEEGK